MRAKTGHRSDRGLALSFLRLARGQEQKALARAAGIHVDTIKRLEQGKGEPNPGTLARITSALGMPLSAIDEVVALLGRLRSEGARLPVAQTTLQVQGLPAATVAADLGVDLASLVLRDLTASRHSYEPVDFIESRRSAPELWMRIDRYSDTVRRELVCHLHDLQSPGLCVLICDKSLDAAGDSSERAESLGDLAVLIASRLPVGAGWRSRLEGYARCHVANALRVGGRDLAAAEKAFAYGMELWQEGAAADPGYLNEARVLHLKASLRRAQRRLDEALALLDEALKIDRWGEMPSLLLGKSRTLEQMGDLQGAIQWLQQAAGHIGFEQEPWKYYIVRKNLAVNLCQLKRYHEAELLLSEIRSMAEGFGKRLELLRVSWLESRVAAGQGRVAEAVTGFEKVRRDFAASHNVYIAALVTLELAEIHATQGKSAEVKALAHESMAIFEALELHSEAQRALDLLRRAA